MPKKMFKNLMPDHQTIKTNKYLQVFGRFLHSPNLWHLNRHSVAKAFAVGLFCAFIPVPFQMVIAAGLAIIVHSNLPMSIAIVWISNPITMPPIFYFCYYIGTIILGSTKHSFEFELSWTWLNNSLSTIGPALLVGCLLLSVLFSVLGYVFIQLLWRYSIHKQWKKRALSRQQVKLNK